MQPRAKINSACYCDQICYWNKTAARHSPFVSTGCSTSTLFMLHCCLPVLPCAGVHWTGKLASNSLELNPVDYSVRRALPQMSQNLKNFRQCLAERALIDCWTKLNQDTLNRMINKLPKKLMMAIKANGTHVEFIWTNSVCRWRCCYFQFTVCSS